MKFGKVRGFSLTEMMIVMLMIAVVLAASAPMVTRKLSRDRSSDKVFDMLPSDRDNAVEYIKGRKQRIYMNGRADGYVGIVESGVNIPKNSILFGNNTVNTGADKIVGIGFNTTSALNSVAIGYNARSNGETSIAIGSDTKTKSIHAVAIGAGAKAEGENSVAMGLNSESLNNSVAIGHNAKAQNKNSVAIGLNAQAEREHQIVLGTQYDTVYIPGNLVVKGDVLLGSNGHHVGIWGPLGHYTASGGKYIVIDSVQEDTKVIKGSIGCAQGVYGVCYGLKLWDYSSDIRLKDVGEAYVGGLDAITQLNPYHFTFKDDEDKTPQVGVMAQDLQKVFPNSVTADSDGWLRIRWDEMFYAAINAIKELNTKISDVIKDITSLKETSQKQQATIESQSETIQELRDEIAKLSERIEKLESSKK